MDSTLTLIKKELQTIRKEMTHLRKNLPDKEMFLDAEEAKLLSESYQHEKEGKLISSSNLKKQLGL